MFSKFESFMPSTDKLLKVFLCYELASRNCVMSWVQKFNQTGFVIENPKVLLNLSQQEETK
jgi:hypothetical protein